MAGGNVRLAGIDPHQSTAALSAGDVLAGNANSRDRLARAAFDHDQSRVIRRLDPIIQACICISVRAESHPQSPNMRIFGRAKAPQRGHTGNG